MQFRSQRNLVIRLPANAREHDRGRHFGSAAKHHRAFCAGLAQKLLARRGDAIPISTESGHTVTCERAGTRSRQALRKCSETSSGILCWACPEAISQERRCNSDLNGIWSYGYLRTRGNTIEAGTSEVQRNIIGHFVLGLPRSY